MQKLLILVALATGLISHAYGQTYPGQFPANTVFGNSTGTTAAPVPGLVTNGQHSNMAARTIKGNSTGSPAAPSDMTVAQVQSISKGIEAAVTDSTYGAACDGVTNDFTAIQNAINGTSGGRLLIPAANCAITLPSATSLATPGAGTIIEGVAKNSSTLTITPTGTTLVSAFTLANANVTFRNLTINVVGDQTGTQNMFLFNLQNSGMKFQNCNFTGNNVEGVLIGGTATNLDQLHVVFTSTALTGSPITISATVSTGEATTAMATALATAINANATISAAGIVATASGSFVRVAQPDGFSPQASYTVNVTGSATETMTIGPSFFNYLWNINQQASPEIDDFLADNVDASGWTYSVLKTNVTTTTNRRWTFRGGFWNRMLTGAMNINSPAGIFDGLVIQGVQIGAVGLNGANDLPIALSNVSNAMIIGNVLEGTYQQNGIHIEENSNGLVISGNSIQVATSSATGASYSGSGIYLQDNNIGGLGERQNFDVSITGNTLRTTGNVSGYGIILFTTTNPTQRVAITGNTVAGFGQGANISAQQFTLVGNMFRAFSAAGTAIVSLATSATGVITNNIISGYTTGVTNSGSTTTVANNQS